jgi:DNA polymerase IV
VGLAATRLVAGIAARQAGATGLTLVMPGDEAAFLAPLPIDRLPRLGESLQERLAGLGVKSIGDLQTMAPGLLAAQFGKEGRRLYDLARGNEESWATGAIVAAEFFDHRLGDPAALRRWAILLCSRVGRQLRERHQTTRSITVTLGHPERPPTALTGQLACPSDVDQTLFRTTERTLEGCRLPGEGVISLQVAARGLVRENPQLSLFPNQAARRDDKLRRVNHAVNGIERKHGEGAILVASILDSEILSHLRAAPAPASS